MIVYTLIEETCPDHPVGERFILMGTYPLVNGKSGENDCCGNRRT